MYSNFLTNRGLHSRTANYNANKSIPTPEEMINNQKPVIERSELYPNSLSIEQLNNVDNYDIEMFGNNDGIEYCTKQILDAGGKISFNGFTCYHKDFTNDPEWNQKHKNAIKAVLYLCYEWDYTNLTEQEFKRYQETHNMQENIVETNSIVDHANELNELANIEHYTGECQDSSENCEEAQSPESFAKEQEIKKIKETNAFQACAQLKLDPVYLKLREEGKCGLEAIMTLQKDIQETVYGHDFSALQSSNKLLSAFYNWNDRAMDSEKEELLASLGGMSTGRGTGAFWKPWKVKDHAITMASSWNELSMEDQFEAWYEWIDAFHFFINKGLAIGMTPQIVTDFYFAKNMENRKRQQNGY